MVRLINGTYKALHKDLSHHLSFLDEERGLQKSNFPSANNQWMNGG